MELRTEYLDATALVAWLTHHIDSDISNAAHCRLTERIHRTMDDEGRIPVRVGRHSPSQPFVTHTP
ncbi:hypothetical protein LCGC14_0746290 [marine sediment metagenome]|uniref:Uncharacterized protein n=1 Tax=marine sediment metagenome TaxID=412755 RepID=A0A0F9Q9J2_9ZZZZ